MVLGHGRDARLARRCGVPVHAITGGGWRGFGFSPSSMRAIVRSLQRAHGPFSLVHAWSMRAADMAAMALPHAPCAVSIMHAGGVRRSVASAARSAIARRQRTAAVRFLAADECVASALAAQGIDRSGITIVQPGVDAAIVEPWRQPAREELRARWGVNDDTLLVGLVTLPVAWGNARAAASVVTLPVTAKRRVKLLVSPDAARLHAAVEWARPLGLDNCLIQDDGVAEPWRVLAGLDVALWLREKPNASPPCECGGLPMLWAFAAGLPLLAERSPASEAIIRHGENGLLFDAGDIPEGARLAVTLHDDSALRKSLAANARRDLELHFSIAHAAKRIGDVYAELARGAAGAESHAQAEASFSSATAAS